MSCFTLQKSSLKYATFVAMEKLTLGRLVMTETQMELQNVKPIAQETRLAGIVLEETHQLLQIASLNAETRFKLVQRIVTTES